MKSEPTDGAFDSDGQLTAHGLDVLEAAAHRHLQAQQEDDDAPLTAAQRAMLQRLDEDSAAQRTQRESEAQR